MVSKFKQEKFWGGKKKLRNFFSKNLKIFSEMVDFVQENMFDNFICNCGEYTAKANMFECATCQVKTFL